jgi:hypothetical protein
MNMTESQGLFIRNNSYFNTTMSRPTESVSKVDNKDVVFRLDARDRDEMRALMSSKIQVQMPWNSVQEDIMRLKDIQMNYPEEVKTPVDKELYLRWKEAEEEKNKNSNWLERIVESTQSSIGKGMADWKSVFDTYREKNMVGRETMSLTTVATSN